VALGVEGVGLLGHQVHDSLEGLGRADGDLHRDDPGAVQLLGALVHQAEEICVLLVHLVDEQDPGHRAVFGQVPGLLQANFHGRVGRCDQDGAFGGAQGAQAFGQEVEESGSVEDVDLAGLPLDGGQGREHGHLALDFVGVEVGRGVAFFDLTQPVDGAGNVQHRFGQRGLSRSLVAE